MKRFFHVAAVATLLALSTHADERMPGGRYTFTGVDVIPIERTKVGKIINDHKSDTLTYWIRFDVHPTFDHVKAPTFQITNPCEGRQSSLTVDKPITFKGKPVPAGTNLLKFKKFNGRFFTVSMPDLNPVAIQSIRIREDFDFPPDTYTFTFKWVTKEGEAFSDTEKVRIDLAR